MPSSSNNLLYGTIGITIAVVIDIVFLLYIKRKSQNDILVIEKRLEEELKKEKKLREKERIGRISVQKRNRDRLTGDNIKLGFYRYLTML